MVTEGPIGSLAVVSGCWRTLLAQHRRLALKDPETTRNLWVPPEKALLCRYWWIIYMFVLQKLVLLFHKLHLASRCTQFAEIHLDFWSRTQSAARIALFLIHIDTGELRH